MTTLHSCTDDYDEPLYSLDVSVYYDYPYQSTNLYPADDEVIVYLFYDIKHQDISPYYEGSGYVFKYATGERIKYSEKKNLDQSLAQFKSLTPNEHLIVIDLMDSKIETWRMIAPNLNHPSQREIKMVLDISPYEPWELYQ
ncbi:hypothetical protein [Ekhidna sp.]|uniref:hypothetical protein n=1 Tax=Ekhidna sp. TaxID=2608089 RepID=UPI0032EE999B